MGLFGLGEKKRAGVPSSTEPATERSSSGARRMFSLKSKPVALDTGSAMQSGSFSKGSKDVKGSKDSDGPDGSAGSGATPQRQEGSKPGSPGSRAAVPSGLAAAAMPARAMGENPRAAFIQTTSCPSLLTRMWARPEKLLTPENLSPANVIGSGYFGTVYRGQWRRTPVAIKEVHLVNHEPAVRDSFIRELEVLTTLRHPNLIQLMGFCVSDAKGYLVLELASNGSLEDWLYPSVSLLYDSNVHSGPGLAVLYSQMQYLYDQEKRQVGHFIGYLHLKHKGPLDANSTDGARLRSSLPPNVPLPLLVVSVGQDKRALMLDVTFQSIDASQLLEGLRSTIYSLKRLHWFAGLKILRDAWRAMHWLHSDRENSRGAILHHDLKPGNILLDESFRAKVADVGLAMRLPVRPSQSHLTTPIMHGGTEGYIDPRARDALRPLKGEKNDVYSFGIVLYETLSACPLASMAFNALAQETFTLASRCVASDWEGRPSSHMVMRHLDSIYDRAHLIEKELSTTVSHASVQDSAQSYGSPSMGQASPTNATPSVVSDAPMAPEATRTPLGNEGPGPLQDKDATMASGERSGTDGQARGAAAVEPRAAAGPELPSRPTDDPPVGSIHVAQGHGRSTSSISMLVSPPVGRSSRPTFSLLPSPYGVGSAPSSSTPLSLSKVLSPAPGSAPIALAPLLLAAHMDLANRSRLNIVSASEGPGPFQVVGAEPSAAGQGMMSVSEATGTAANGFANRDMSVSMPEEQQEPSVPSEPQPPSK